MEKNSSSAVTLEIRDGKGDVVRRYASTDPVAPVGAKLKIPTYCVRPPQALSSEKGIHRFLWDMHYAPVPDVEPEYPMAAVYGKTAPEATSPWAVPEKEITSIGIFTPTKKPGGVLLPAQHTAFGNS